jgi:hypothetical protein
MGQGQLFKKAGGLMDIVHYKCGQCGDLFQLKIPPGKSIPEQRMCYLCCATAHRVGEATPSHTTERVEQIIKLIKLCVEYGMQIPDSWIDELNRIGRKED